MKKHLPFAHTKSKRPESICVGGRHHHDIGPEKVGKLRDEILTDHEHDHTQKISGLTIR